VAAADVGCEGGGVKAGQDSRSRVRGRHQREGSQNSEGDGADHFTFAASARILVAGKRSANSKHSSKRAPSLVDAMIR
jgi:hypothetical protein